MRDFLRLIAVLFLALGLSAPALAYYPETLPSNADGFQDFTTSTGPRTSLWTNIYQNYNVGTSYSDTAATGLQISMHDPLYYPGENSSYPYGTGIGFEQTTSSACNTGFGAGRFHYRAYLSTSGQGGGANLILWDADGSWGQTPAWADGVPIVDEWDVLETEIGNGVQTGVINVHHGATNLVSNPFVTNAIGATTGTLNTPSDYDVDWVSGTSMTE